MKAEELDRLFDEGGDITAYIDWSTAKRPNLVNQSISVDLPVWLLRELDLRAQSLAVTRDSLIRLLLAERLDKATPSSAAAAEQGVAASRG